MHFIEILIIGIAELIIAIFSSIAQGGGNYIIVSVLLIVGVTPVAANAALSVSNIGFTIGNIAGLRGVPVKDKVTLGALMATSISTGLFAPYIMSKMNSHFYSLLIGIMLLIIAPILYSKPFGTTNNLSTGNSKIFGYFIILLLTIMARFTLGIGALFSYVLCRYCGLTILEANLYRKISGFFASIIVAIGVILGGFVNWPITISLTIASILGAFIGARITVKKGNNWTSKVMTATMFVSGVILIIINI